MSEKAEKLLQSIAAPLIVATIVAIACTFVSYKILEDRHGRTEHRLTELEASRKDDRKLSDELIYRIDTRLAAIERAQERMLGKMEARDSK